MDPSRGTDSRYNMNYSMSGIGLGLVDQADIYGNPAAVAALGGRQPSGCLIQPMSSVGVGLSSRGGGSLMPNTSQCTTLGNPNQNSGSITVNSGSHQRGIKRAGSDCYDDNQNRNSNIGMSNQTMQGLDNCNSGSNTTQQQQQQQQQQHHQSSSNVSEVEESYVNLQNKKSPPANGKKTKGRVKIKMEYIDNKLRRYTTFSKRKTGIMKKAYELSTLTGTQVMLLVASETGHVYTFATRKLQPMITSEAGKQLIQTCLNSPDPPSVGGGDQRMSATGFEETELSYNITDEDSKEDLLTSENESDDSSDAGAPSQSLSKTTTTPPATASKSNQEQFNISSQQQLQQQQQQQHATTALEASEMDHKSGVQNLANINKRQTASVGQDKLQTKTTQASTAAVVADNEKNVLLTSEAFANLPKEILLELIKSGHLQLHAEEDGSGHQYVAIPLKPTVAAAAAAAAAASASASNMKSANRAQLNTNLAQLDKSTAATTTPATSSSSSITSSSLSSSSMQSSSVAYNDVTIKQEKF